MGKEEALKPFLNIILIDPLSFFFYNISANAPIMLKLCTWPRLVSCDINLFHSIFKLLLSLILRQAFSISFLEITFYGLLLCYCLCISNIIRLLGIIRKTVLSHKLLFAFLPSYSTILVICLILLLLHSSSPSYSI